MHVTTSSLDMRYGRQGGRIVPWIAPDRRFAAGQIAMLEDHRVVIVDDDLPNRRYRVRFDRGAQLVVTEDCLEELVES